MLTTDDCLGGRPGRNLRFHTQAVRGYDIVDLQELRLKMGEGLNRSRGPERQAVHLADVRNEPRYCQCPRAHPFGEWWRRFITNEEVIGVFDLESDELNAYSNDDVEVLLLLASQVAIIIEKVMLHEQLIEKQRLETQLEVRGRCSWSCLPARDPELEGFDISAYNFPTEEVSGDYYDWVRLYDDQIGFVIADVSGKGVPAAPAHVVLARELARRIPHRICAAHLDVQGQLSAMGIHRA
jgi:hypothetical protein